MIQDLNPVMDTNHHERTSYFGVITTVKVVVTVN